MVKSVVHLSKPLISFNLLASSSFLKSFVFCAKSLRWVSVSLWCATRSEATVSSWGTSVVRSMSGLAVSALDCYLSAQTRTPPCAYRLPELVLLGLVARAVVFPGRILRAPALRVRDALHCCAGCLRVAKDGRVLSQLVLCISHPERMYAQHEYVSIPCKRLLQTAFTSTGMVMRAGGHYRLAGPAAAAAPPT